MTKSNEVVSTRLDQNYETLAKRLSLVKHFSEEKFEDARKLIDDQTNKLHLLASRDSLKTVEATFIMRVIKFEEEIDEYQRFMRDLNLKFADVSHKMDK